MHHEGLQLTCVLLKIASDGTTSRSALIRGSVTRLIIAVDNSDHQTGSFICVQRRPPYRQSGPLKRPAGTAWNAVLSDDGKSVFQYQVLKWPYAREIVDSTFFFPEQ